MNGTRQPQERSVPSEEVRAEAAAWVARLHDEKRSPGLDAGIRAWLGESEDHRRAFNRMMLVWKRSGSISMRAHGDISAARTGRRPPFPSWRATAAATLILSVISVVVVVYNLRDNSLVTAVGQQKTRQLRDGTRVRLNTDTRIEVNFDEHARRVRLIRGEAWFDVSKQPTWPFLVTVDGQEIRAVGTSFIVRHDDTQGLSITLVEGKISVASTDGKDQATPPDTQVLTAGQRLLIPRNQARIVDRPEMTRITAWERGRVEFDETPLGTAVKEMNRYSTKHVAVANAEVAQLRVGGVFHAGDSEEFVRIVTAAFGLRADRSGGAIVLSPSADPPSSRIAP
jgi:transmembrane sensor